MITTDPTKFERDYPGCSLHELPWWPSSKKVWYRTVPITEQVRHGVGRLRDWLPSVDAPLYGPNGGGRTQPMLIASRGKNTLACWSVVGQMWIMVCP